MAATKHTDIPERFIPGWIEGMDNRTNIAKAINARYKALCDDLGGVENLSYQRLSLVKRSMWLECRIEQDEIALARGDDVDPGRMAQAINTYINLLRTLGLDKVRRDVTLATIISESKS